jgi:two-component system phosphate regulon response regulator PhoB
MAASASLDPLESAPEVARLLLEHGDAGQKLLDPHLEAGEGIAGLSQLGNREADCEQEQLLDLNLRSMEGLDVCRMIRRQSATAHVPIIIVSARSEEVDRVLGLEMGAADCMVKPFSVKELATRCRAALRRAETASGPGAYPDENLCEVEYEAYLVRYRGQEVRLTPKEFELFRYMVERPGRVVTRERLLEHVWGYDTDIETRSIDAHIRRLRMKLGPARDHVETIVGLGYRFVPNPSRSAS